MAIEFIELTDLNSNKVYINIATINSISVLFSTNNTYINFSEGDNFIQVSESIEEVMSKMKELQDVEK